MKTATENLDEDDLEVCSQIAEKISDLFEQHAYASSFSSHTPPLLEKWVDLIPKKYKEEVWKQLKIEGNEDAWPAGEISVLATAFDKKIKYTDVE
jgi:hypothetical protein